MAAAMSPEALRVHLAQRLASATTGVLCAAGGAALPVRYHSSHLAVSCLLPRWADLAYAIEAQPAVTLIIALAGDATCWLQYEGLARVAERPGDEPDRANRTLLPLRALPGYLLLAIQPLRLDLFDQGRGWGARDTLELGRRD
jgi:hypothetical protein